MVIWLCLLFNGVIFTQSQQTATLMSCDYKHTQEPQLKLTNLWGNTVRKGGEWELDQLWITGYAALQQNLEVFNLSLTLQVKEKKEQSKGMNNPDHFHNKVRVRSHFTVHGMQQAMRERIGAVTPSVNGLIPDCLKR